MKYLKKWYINLSIQRKILYCTLGVALVVLLAASVSQFCLCDRAFRSAYRYYSKRADHL